MAAAAVGAMLLVACGSRQQDQWHCRASKRCAGYCCAGRRQRRRPQRPQRPLKRRVPKRRLHQPKPRHPTTPAGLVGDTPATAGPDCGLGNGQKATGAPIKLGNVTTSIPGIDFTTGPAMMKGYFDCVNDNGGINGRPVQMLEENDNGKPEDAAAAAKKLIETDKVVAMVGGFSILDCPVNADYYKQQGYYVIVAGVPAECFSSPNIAAANMGPGYSALGAAQIVIDKGAKGKMVTMTGKSPTSAYNDSLAGLYAKSKGLEWEDEEIDLPISDANNIIQDAVNKAGQGGAIVLNFTPPEGLKLLKAAEELGLIDKVIWGSSTPLNDNSVAAALGPAWNGKLNVNAELSLLDDPRPEMELYRTVSAKYNAGCTVGKLPADGLHDRANHRQDPHGHATGRRRRSGRRSMRPSRASRTSTRTSSASRGTSVLCPPATCRTTTTTTSSRTAPTRWCSTRIASRSPKSSRSSPPFVRPRRTKA